MSMQKCPTPKKVIFTMSGILEKGMGNSGKYKFKLGEKPNNQKHTRNNRNQY